MHQQACRPRPTAGWQQHSRPGTPTGQLCRPCTRRRLLPLAAAAPIEDTATPQLKQQFLNYHRMVRLPSGHNMVIKPLTAAWLQRTGDVLADAFVSAAGVQAYRAFVRRNISRYLAEHLSMPPRALVLVALRQHLDAGTEDAGASADSAGSIDTSNSMSSSSSNGADGSGDASQASSSSSSSNSASTSTSSSLSTISSLLAEPLAPAAVSTRALHSLPAAARREVLEAAAVPPPPRGFTLVGSAEVSFDRSTHSRYMTLNPPEGAAYLSNMAVAETSRRQGIGMHLVTAAEEVARLAGRHELFLHLRFVDEAAAGLYRKAGFEERAADGWWTPFIGQERRYLMVKRL